MRLSNSLVFTAAARQRFRVGAALACVVLGLMVVAAPLVEPTLAARVAPVLSTAAAAAVAASLLIILVGLASAALVETARDMMLRAEHRLDDFQMQPPHDDDRIRAFKRAAWPAGWPHVLVTFGLSLAAAAAAWHAMRAPLAAALDDPYAVPFAIAALVACFPLVVIERHLVAGHSEAFPEGEGLARLARVLIASLLCLALGRLVVHAGFAWGVLAPRPVAVLTFAVAAELAVRALARGFLPFPVPDHAVGALSTIAGLLRLTAPSSHAAAAALQNALGIDVSQSWALGFLRRALVPSAVGLAVSAWLLSGLVALQTNERAVYERFGRPVGVLGPGLHLILPWPAGRLRPVELGVMHDLPLGTATRAAQADETTDRGDDRLWDRPHIGDATYLIASRSGDKQGFQVVDIDMRILWQVGASAADALAFAYHVETPAAVIRGLAGRRLAQRFAGSTLPAVLVEDRAAFIETFRAALQADCDALHMGVHVSAIIIEAIHPPTGAAAAYHAVQASELRARVAIAQARGVAIEAEAQSRQDAKTVGDEALVSSASILAAARTASQFFDADLAAWKTNGSAFLLERRLEQIGKALPTRQLIIVDHRLGPESVPLLDLRGTTALP